MTSIMKENKRGKVHRVERYFRWNTLILSSSLCTYIDIYMYVHVYNL